MQTNKRVIFTVVAVFIVAGLILGLVSSQQTSAARGIAWKHDFAAASKDAAKANKPMMVDFYADWCGYCKKLDREVFTNDKVIDTSAKFVAVKLDTEKDSKTPRKYNIRGLPTIVFFNNGKEIHRVVGFKPADQFVKEMNKALDKAK